MDVAVRRNTGKYCNIVCRRVGRRPTLENRAAVPLRRNGSISGFVKTPILRFPSMARHRWPRSRMVLSTPPGQPYISNTPIDNLKSLGPPLMAGETRSLGSPPLKTHLEPGGRKISEIFAWQNKQSPKTPGPRQQAKN